MADSEGNLDSWMPPRSAPRSAAPPAPPARPSQLTGAILDDRYKLQGYLSRGTLSRSYLAHDLEGEGSVVIKLLAPDGDDGGELAARITREAERRAPIRHPNLIDLLGVGKTPAGQLYLVMEGLPGEPLDEVLRRSPRLPSDLALVLARQAATGLSALHKDDLVHGRVRPSNLMVLGAPGEPYGTKVLDYGLAQLWNDPEPDPETPAFEGLPYLAPEQILLEAVDARADVFALGVVLYRMLIGHLPFEASEGPLLRHQLFSQIPQATWLEAGLDPRLEAVILNATRKRPENRYASMAELLRDLDAIVGLSAANVEIRPLDRNPDDYDAQTEAGQQRLNRLRHRFSSVPPSSNTLGAG